MRTLKRLHVKRFGLGLMFLLGTLAANPAQAQTKAVTMNFCDQTILDDPFADSKAVLASGFSKKQESDFVPKSELPKPDDLTGELKSDASASDKALEPLRLENKEDAQDLKEEANNDKDPDDQDPIEQDPIKKLGSDDPVEPPTFKLNDEESDDSSSDKEQQSPSDGPVQQNLNDGYQLPTVADVRSPISHTPMANTSQSDPSNLLLNDQNANFNQRYISPISNYAEISGRPAFAKYKTWRAHDVFHRPTYFEDQNLELNGNQRPFQNAASALSFFSTIPRLPYLIGEQLPDQRIYTFGEDRPGDLAPFRAYQSMGNRRGQIFQTIATLGIILP